MLRSVFLSLLVRQALVLGERFRTRYPNAWLVWEAGEWTPADEGEQDVAATLVPLQDDLRDCLPSGEDALCFELVPASARPVLGVGRASHNALVVNDATVSRDHLTLTPVQGGGWALTVLASAGPATLGGKPLAPGATLRLTPGAELTLGDVRMTFHDAASFAERVERVARLVAQRAGALR